MRNVVLSLLFVSGLGACATVSMVPAEATVETGITSEQSSLRKISTAYIDQAERKNWIAKNRGLLDFARVLMDGNSEAQTKQASYTEQLLADTETRSDRIARLAIDIDSAAHGLEVATMEAEKLLQSDRAFKGLRTDLVSYESVLVTAQKARRTFVSTLSEVDSKGQEGTSASEALTTLDLNINEARKAADKLADFVAQKKNEATS